MPGKTILVVEDDANQVFAYRHILAGAGYDCQASTDGVGAMNLARNLNPCLVILDFHFPAGGGAAFHQRLRLSTFTMTIPVLIVSSSPEEAVRGKVAFDPMTYYLQKPYDPGALLKKVGDIVSGNATPQTSS